jgi:hypothetical protein
MHVLLRMHERNPVAAKKNSASNPTGKPVAKPFGSKTKFVLSLSQDLSAKQVVEQAKKSGFTIAEGHVHNIRSMAKMKARKTSLAGVRPPRSREAASPEAASGRYANHEALLIEAAIHVGLAKASDLLDRLRAHVKSGF